MIPGMTERDRLANDVRVLEWLADATIGPAHIGRAVMAPPESMTPCPTLPAGLGRRGLSAARMLGQHFRLLEPASRGPLPDPASASGQP